MAEYQEDSDVSELSDSNDIDESKGDDSDNEEAQDSDHQNREDSSEDQEESENDEVNEDNGAAAAADADNNDMPLKRIDGGHWCYKCKKTIKGAPAKFKRHYLQQHGPGATKKFFFCGLCKRTYTAIQSLSRHIKDQHPEKMNKNATPDKTQNKEVLERQTPKERKTKKTKDKQGAAHNKPEVAVSKPMKRPTVNKILEPPLKKIKVESKPNEKPKEVRQKVKQKPKSKEKECKIRNVSRISLIEAKAQAEIAVAQAKAEAKARAEIALATAEAQGRVRVALAQEKLYKIQQKLEQIDNKPSASRKRYHSSDSGEDGDVDSGSLKRKKKQNENIITERAENINDGDVEEEVEPATNLPIADPDVTTIETRFPEVLQISGPHLDDILEGRDPMANIPTDYTEADKVMRANLKKDADAKVASGGMTQLENMRENPLNRDQIAFGEASDRYVKYDKNNRTIASDHYSRILLGFNDKYWRTWTDVFSFFASVSLFQMNKFDNDNLVYVHPIRIKARAKNMVKPAEEYLRSKGVPLTENGKMNLRAICPHLSMFYKIIINVHSERKVNLTRLLDDNDYDSNWPQLDLLRTETGHFCVIKDIMTFSRAMKCKQCSRIFNDIHNLNRHLRGKSCPFAKFVEKCGIERIDEFITMPNKDEYMVKHTFTGGKVRPPLKIKEKLENFGIPLDSDFIFNPYYAVSDIETFLVQMIHKSINGEEIVIGRGNKLLIDNHHDPACVSIISNLGNKFSYCQNFMCTDSSSKFILNYAAYLREISEFQSQLIMDKHKNLFNQLKQLRYNATVQNKMCLVNSLSALMKEMESEAQKVQVFFFNSVFDLNCLVRHGLCWFLQVLSGGERPRALKNGNDYICLTAKFVVFKDILKFTAAKVSLPAFLYTYQVPDRYSKMTFPYELLTSPSALMISLPVRYDSFYSKLRRENTLEAPHTKYLSLLENGLSKEDALKEMKMTEEPLTGPEMYDYINGLCQRKNLKYLYQLLAVYCDMDCVGLMLAIGRMRESFKNLTGLDMFEFLTLPNLAYNWALREVGTYPEPTLNHFVKLGEEAHNLILPGLRGGATMIGNRLSIAGITKIKPHQFPPEQQKTVKKQLYLDANTLYGGTCKLDNPVLGSYAIRHKKDNFFYNKILEKGLGALSWLLYRARMVEKQEIRTIRSVNSEKTILLKDQTRARLDGWLNVQKDPVTGHMKGISFEFHDFTHSHPSDPWFNNKPPGEFENGINPITKKPHNESYERTLARDDMIRAHPDVIEHHVMWSYIWDKRIDENPDLFEFVKDCILREGPDPVEMQCTWERMLELILEGRIHGMVLCSLNTPDHLIEKFSIFPPFFNHKLVGRDDCAPVERAYAEKYDLLEAPQQLLTNELRVENTVISTDLLKFYVKKLELEVTNIETVVQFKGAAKVLENMLEKCKQYRDEGVRTGKPVKKEIGKLLLNGFYGSSLLNMDSRRNVSYVEQEKMRNYSNKPVSSSAFAGPSWNPGRLVEMEMRKLRVTENKPKHLGIWILNASKMVLLKFIYLDLYHYLEPASWEINGLDTDGIIISIAGDDLLSICKPHLLDEFKEKYKTIFAVDNDQAHTPHLFKTEMESVIYVGLATKSYIMLNKDSPIGKVATKGIPNKSQENQNLVGLVNFLQTLFDMHPSAPPIAIVRGIRCDQFKNMATYMQMKQGLSRMAAKQGFHKCAIHYYPLELKDDSETLEKLYPYTDICQCYDTNAVWRQIKRLSIEFPQMKLRIPDILISDRTPRSTTLDSSDQTRSKSSVRRVIGNSK